MLALELAEEGIRVNVICPGLVEGTELGDAIFSPEQVAALWNACVPATVLPLDGARHLSMNASK